MLKTLIGIMALVGAYSTAAYSSSILLGPEGSFSSLLGRLEYDPTTACTKPRKPYRDDQYAISSYRSDINTYVSCLRRAAEQDMDYASKVVSEGHKDAVENFISELKRGY